MTGKLKKMHAKTRILGHFFVPEKYVIRVLFVSPWTSLIPPLAIRVAPPGNTFKFRLLAPFVEMFWLYEWQQAWQTVP